MFAISHFLLAYFHSCSITLFSPPKIWEFFCTAFFLFPLSFIQLPLYFVYFVQLFFFFLVGLFLICSVFELSRPAYSTNHLKHLLKIQ